MTVVSEHTRSWTAASPLRLIGYGHRAADDSVPSDERRLRLWARHSGVRIVEVILDEPDLAPADGLRRALNRLRRGRADGLVVPSLPSLGRELLVQEAAAAVVWKYGHRLFTIDTGEVLPDSGDAMRRMMRQVIDRYAALDESLWEPDFPEATGSATTEFEDVGDLAMRRIIQLYERGNSLRAIARRLNAEGLPSHRGRRWHANSVARLYKRVAEVAGADEEEAVAG